MIALVGLLVPGLRAAAQSGPARRDSLTEQTAAAPARPVVPGQDVADIAHRLFPRLPAAQHDSLALQSGHAFVWVVVTPGYALQTRLLLDGVTNVAFQRPRANMSTIGSELIYTQNKQGVLTIASSIWASDNRVNWVGDWRLMHFPEDTYGLGTRTLASAPLAMNFNYLRFYQSALRKIGPDLYAGLGYQLDYHWQVVTAVSPADQPVLGEYSASVNGSSVSSGITLNFLMDSRGKAINPTGGMYANVVLRPNLQRLGSDTNYQSLLLDVRKYLRLPNTGGNILAFWSYSWLTLSGNPPYLDLPSTGWDTYGNVGRGFIQGRFRGRNLLYGEAEYRFAITRNRLLGGVVFANAQSAAEPLTQQLLKVVPAAGVGLRLRINKVSGTNLAIDYGLGADGSRGLFFNLGEVF